MASTFVEVDGCVLHVREDGPKNGPVLLFSNSLGTDLRIWDAVVDALSDRWRCIRMDKRGHGLSALGSAPVTLERYAADALGVMDALGVDRAVMVGVSIGGLIAQATYAARPDAFAGLMLCDTAAKIGAADLWQQRIDMVRTDGLEAMADTVLQRWFAPAFHRDRAVDLGGYRQMLTRTPAEGYAAACAALRDADYTAKAAAIAVPCVVICGAEDGATTPEVVSAFAATVPTARYVELPDVGHLPSIEAPDTVVSHLKALLKEVNHG
ncbi:3-oxoadipate enol-lactonase [Thalassobaculum sp. OXR-137]|uniref:3-oxoadipate enol-lactonase n=1 Tax=Thalassobaculum sp. OXR-137 TaxID=3100173 RepID=UPI002AC8C01A|nr:3-oxoadipate enol-lactonase [Thalassobaculum sp. OXR-137]WPZ36498.1 3-oxoadipate enol-lactonase [Thalassobaculum sp. OXR-137]